MLRRRQMKASTRARAMTQAAYKEIGGCERRQCDSVLRTTRSLHFPSRPQINLSRCRPMMLHVLSAALLVLLGAGTHTLQQQQQHNLQNNETPFLLSDLPFLDTKQFDPSDSSVDVWQQLESMPPLLDALPDLLYVEEVPSKRGGGSSGAARRRPGSHKRHPDRYECKPSREDVVRLLLALHEARGGNSGRTVNFCNRKRPARNILTNLRFVGR